MTTSPLIEIHFPVLGQTLPVDHGYLLYSALCGHLPFLHHDGEGIAVGPINGQWTGDGLLAVCSRRSRLRVRLPSEQIPSLLGLAGKSLDLAGHRLRLGVPTVQTLVPAAAVIARLVTIKHAVEAETFLAAARAKLDESQFAGEPAIPVVTEGARQGEPRRKILRIRDKKVIGFSLQVTGLTAEESIRLQEHGLGGRRKMGCGFFVPMKGEARS